MRRRLPPFLMVSNQVSPDFIEHTELASHSDARDPHRLLNERPHESCSISVPFMAPAKEG